MAASRSRAPSTHLALLRGINVGGKNLLSMKDLVAIFAAIGCEDVRTWIQSGNVVFSARTAIAKQVPAAVSAAIEQRFGLRVAVVTRTARELAAVARSHPLDDPGVDAKTLHVGFLAAKPALARVRALDPERSPPDRFVVLGQELYLHCPNGLARTKLTNDWFDRQLGTTSTVRTWRTVQKLCELADHG